MTTDEALAVLRPLIDDCERKCWHPTPCDDCARPRSALDHLASLAADTGPCRAHACRRVRTEMQAEIERLRAAIARQVANIDRWLETGIPADADESRSIYDQLCEAIGTAMAKERGE